MAVRKEPNSFALESVDIRSYTTPESKAYHLLSVYEQDEYLSLFSGAEKEQELGEVSNLYLNSGIAPLSIKGYAPDVNSSLFYVSQRIACSPTMFICLKKIGYLKRD